MQALPAETAVVVKVVAALALPAYLAAAVVAVASLAVPVAAAVLQEL